MWAWAFCLLAAFLGAESAGAGAARLVCYVDSARATEGFSECTHLVYAGDARGEKLESLLKEYRKNNPRLKIVLRVAEGDKDFRTLVKSKHVQGLEINDAHKSLNKSKILETVEEARSAISSNGGGPLFLALPANPELLAKYYDLRVLVKKVDLMMVQTHALGAMKKMTYHASRLSGLWDMMNTDSVVDLVVGLGVPASKVVISLPATARQFTLVNETLSTPGSPARDDEPKEIDQAELCRLLQKGRWTLERDQDLSGPYAFKNTTWISFEDSSSVDVKGKYARVRGLAGLALHRAELDTETPCGPTLKQSLAKVLNQQSRAPRAAVLRSLEHEILSAPGHARALDALQVSPYRITQVVDSDGVIHSIREDTRTEFTCSRQGYFVHPRSCARFYRCVKFDQLSPEYTVFEFDCPAGLAFDSRYEVCVWPGSLPHSQACPGSSEIAPVPQTRFICPEHEGYYADPENCRWFFACLDHGKAPLTAYEFRCPFGLGFDAARLKCDWPWLVPACGNIARYEAEAHGFSGAALSGAVGFQGQTADSINVAAHQSLVSGASLDNLVGIQNGFLTKDDSLDSNFIASQELSNGAYSGGQGFEISHGSSGFGDGQGLAYQVGDATFTQGNVGLVQPTKYSNEQKYTSGSLILDDYRLPTQGKHGHGKAQNLVQSNLQQNGQYNGYNGYSSGNVAKIQYQKVESGSYEDNSGAYVHDPSGDYAEPYRHEDSPAAPYVHSDSGYKQSSDYYDVNRYSGSSSGSYGGKYVEQGGNDGKYVELNSGQYAHDNSGAYVESGTSGSGYNGNAGSYSYSTGNSGVYSGNGDVSGSSGSYSYSSNGYKDNSGAYNADYSGSYKNDDAGKYVAGVYRADGHIGSNAGLSGSSQSQLNIDHGTYSIANSGNYLSDSKAYTGASHTLTAGAINVGLVGKTTLVDADYSNQGDYQAGSNGYSFGSTVSHGATHQTVHPGHVSYISQPAVSIHHLGTDGNNLDGYEFATTPTSSGIPTTATPFAVTTAIPVTTYRTTFVPEPPKTSIKQIFTHTQPEVTYVKPAVVAVKQYVTPKVEVSDYNQGINVDNGYSYSSGDYSTQSSTKSESGYVYNKPSVKFEEGVTYSTPAPVVSVSTYKPQGFSHSQQTLHKVESVGFEYSTPTPIYEEPFKKIVAYTTGPSVSTYVQPTVATVPQSFSHQTIHKVETNHAYTPSVEVGNDYSKSEISYQQPETIVQYTTAQPAVVSSTYAPQVISHQTLHKVDASKINAYSQNSESGYEYKQPEIKFEEGSKVFEYSTPAPVVSSTYQPQVYSHQTIHKFETKHAVPVSSTASPEVAISYQPAVTVYENPIIKYTQKPTPITYVESLYKPQSYSHQTIHKTETKSYTPSVDVGSYESSVSYEQPSVVHHYTTAQPALAVQQVVSTYQPQVISHQTLHKVEASKVNTYSHEAQSGYEYQKPQVSYEESGYEYNKPAVKYEEGPKEYIQYTTPTPIQVSTYKPQTYSHQTIHKVETQKYVPVSSTALPQVEVSYQQPTVSVYENPLFKYSEPAVTPATYVKPTPIVYTQTFKPVVAQHEVTHISQPVQYQTNDDQSYSHHNIQFSQEGYSYSQPEIQRNEENLNAAKSYSDASVVSHQVFHQTHVPAQTEKVVFVSTSPSTLAYEEHYSEYDSSKKDTYKAPEYIPPKTDYQQSYSVVSTASTPIVQHNSAVYHQTQDQSDYQSSGYSQQYDSVPVQQVSFSTSHVTQPKKVVTKYKQVGYQSPEIQVAYKAEEYLPPVLSTETPYIVSSTYKPSTYSTAATTREYLPPVSEVKYEVDNSYLPPPTTARPIVKSTTQAPTYKYVESTTKYQAPDYLPPQEDSNSKTVHFESFGYNNYDGYDSKVQYNPYQEYKSAEDTVVSSTYAPVQRKQNIVVETVKSHLLGFGTVGPDAGLVSPASYTTAAPVVSTTYRPIKYTTSAPTYKYVQSTTEYKAPEYLPPSEETESAANFESFGYKNVESSKIKYNPYEASVDTYQAPVERKHNIVIETAKSNQLGFGIVGPDAGLVSQVSYTTSAPIEVSSQTYSVPQRVSTPVYKQELVEVTPSPAYLPVRRTKPKVAVVTKINDFNPLLVRKLGAVCSCQSPVLVLKGRRPNVQAEQDFDDYSNDYDGRGDINDNQWAQKTARIRTAATAAPIVSSTLNPIIVPDDSYYQDLQDGYESRDKQVYSNGYVSSTSAVFSTTEKIVKLRPRIKSVTVAPTYKTVLLNQEVAPTVITKQAGGEASAVDSQAFDRYGPGGWRSRDETLQGSVDCQRAGLFRHPKQCNKFYACRWDCTKQRFTLHVFNCPVQLSFDESLGACNWPSQGPACQGDTLLTNTL
ncbi:uncharacterized protein LOC135074696 [Ostrinia nubilalis]|uniref:uncharacterized protein LOC135074696 n=1 Tax=Ostrinia nubilalis TaxID=29057 RepID=UPI003082310A